MSTPEATALDLARDVTFAGGIDNVATVLAELDEETQLGDAALAAQAKRAPAAAARRLGWLLQEFAGRDDLDRFRGVALAGPATPARVDPTGSSGARSTRNGTSESIGKWTRSVANRPPSTQAFTVFILKLSVSWSAALPHLVYPKRVATLA